MPDEAELRRRLALAKYPRRADARPSDAEDHNPLVLEACPECHGEGTQCIETAGGASMDTCPACEGVGVTGNVVRMFPNDSPALSAEARDGWVRCPNCQRRFALKDPHRWTGLRHVGCGQRIVVATGVD